MDPSPQSPVPGQVEDLAPGLRRVLAPNPSPMTYWGTNTYLLGDREIAVIDPGPDNAAHLEAILAALRPGQKITQILVTHAHRDHSPLARALADRTGAPVLAYGPAASGRSALMQGLVADGLAGGGEGVDTEFAPDRCLPDGAQVTGAGWTLTALWTPGHMGNHMAFLWDDILFTGDLVMGWASSLISPPDGDLAAFLSSCHRLRDLGSRILHPGHGLPVADPAARIDWLIAHRHAREAQILSAIPPHGIGLSALTRAIYDRETPAALMPAAERNVLAHLIDLTTRGKVQAAPNLSPSALFSLA
ncbi:MBL fold metallo-hydrolase [Meridianimarinicoccus sp. MJW13]|uniref:MBL fold metallo-hydrolase n=1 Tax=Meridianimarinicoccus sp. MJW13 TaxID=2720031 RepID=UPI0018688AAB|nr:MBL fold metallo-hydrolase [Fluviibacterium sp. MJW13]